MSGVHSLIDDHASAVPGYVDAAVERADRLRERLKATQFDYRKAIDVPPTVLSLNGIAVATSGNILILKGPEKAGKSGVFGAAITSTLVDGNPEIDTLGFHSENREGHMVLHLDCEQSPYHHSRMMRDVMRRAKMETLPDWVVSHCLRGFSPAEIMASVELLLEEGEQRFGGIHSVWLDGFGDLVVNVNDTDAVGTVVSRLMALSAEYHTVIVGVVHQNPGAENTKARGVLGSELQRKVETSLTVESAGKGYELFTSLSRNAPIRKGEGVRYEWSHAEKMFVTDLRGQSEAREALKAELTPIMRTALADRVAQGHSDLVEVLRRQLNCGVTKAKNVIREAKSLEIVQITSDKRYVLTGS